MQALYDELMINIFIYVTTPISLVLASRKWYVISLDPHARAKWLINKYGKAHALFHAVRLENFMIKNSIQALLANDVIISQYFVQRLLMHFGIPDPRLNELKVEHNVNNVNSVNNERISPQKSAWASNLSLGNFIELVTKCYEELIKENELAIKGNDMELFHFLSAGPLTIYHAPQRLFQNLNEIKNLILNKKFIPFPPRPKPTYEDTVEYIQLMQARVHEDYPPKDGYENSRQLNVVARAILIYPDLVLMWQEIGYEEICMDLNELVMQGALLILFPPTIPINWECPNVDIVAKRLRQLINLGFKLTGAIMEEAFHLFEHRLDRFGDILMDSFCEVHKKSKSFIASSCLIQAIKPERNHRNTNLLDFLINRIEDQPEKALNNALNYHNVGLKYDANSIKTVKMRSLSVHSNFYYWVLKNMVQIFEITKKCFDDVIESRVWLDLKLQESPERNIPEHLTQCAYNSICSIYLEYCNEIIPFKVNHLSYLKLVKSEEIIRPFFGISLPTLFGLQLSYRLPYEINYDYNRPEVNNTQNNKRKFNEMDDQSDKNEWIESFEKLYNEQILDNSDVSETFKNNLEEFWERIKGLQSNDEISSKRSKQ